MGCRVDEGRKVAVASQRSLASFQEPQGTLAPPNQVARGPLAALIAWQNY